MRIDFLFEIEWKVMMNLIETNLFVVGKNIIELIIVYNKFTKCSNRSFAWSIRRNVRRPISADPFCLQSVQRGRAFCVTTTIEFSLVHASCCLCCERLDSFLLLLFGFIVGILCVQMVHLDLSTSVQCHWLLGRQDKTEQWTQKSDNLRDHVLRSAHIHEITYFYT